MKKAIKLLGKGIAITIHQFKEGWKEGQATNRLNTNEKQLIFDTGLHNWNDWMNMYWSKQPHFSDYATASEFYRKHRKAYEDKRPDKNV